MKSIKYNGKKKFIMMRTVDYILIFSLFSFAVFLFIYLPIYFGKEPGSMVSVDAVGKSYGIYDLNKNQRIEVNVNGHINTLVIEDGYVTMVDANCSDKVCVNHGPMDKTYDAIVCLPNQVVVKILKLDDNKDEESDEIDSISS